jgi:hypothetical protein
MLGWDRYGFHKKHGGTCYAEPVVLHLVVSVGQVVNLGVSGLQNIDAVFFMLGWDQYGLYQKCIKTCHIKLMFLSPV